MTETERKKPGPKPDPSKPKKTKHSVTLWPADAKHLGRKGRGNVSKGIEALVREDLERRRKERP